MQPHPIETDDHLLFFFLNRTSQDTPSHPDREQVQPQSSPPPPTSDLNNGQCDGLFQQQATSQVSLVSSTVWPTSESRSLSTSNQNQSHVQDATAPPANAHQQSAEARATTPFISVNDQQSSFVDLYPYHYNKGDPSLAEYDQVNNQNSASQNLTATQAFDCLDSCYSTVFPSTSSCSQENHQRCTYVPYEQLAPQSMYLPNCDQVNNQLDSSVFLIEPQSTATAGTESNSVPMTGTAIPPSNHSIVPPCNSLARSRHVVQSTPLTEAGRFDQTPLDHPHHPQAINHRASVPLSTSSQIQHMRQSMDEEDDDEFHDTLRGDIDQKRLNHSAIEKRRREKMNSHIKELASIIPLCSGISRKMDKLTVLRMAVQYIKSIRGSMMKPHSTTQVKPSFVSTKKIHELILKVAEGFLFVVSCDRGKILFITESVSQTLGYSNNDLIGQNWFDILHPKDVKKVKEELKSYDMIMKKDRLIDQTSILSHKRLSNDLSGLPRDNYSPVNANYDNSEHAADSMENSTLGTLSPGARRAFFCRMKRKTSTSQTNKCDEQAADVAGESKKKKSATDKKYTIIHCIGYIKSCPTRNSNDKLFEKSSPIARKTAAPATAGKSSGKKESDDDEIECDLSCLVAVARTIPSFTPPTNSQSIIQCSMLSREMKETSCNIGKTISADFVDYISRHTMDGKFLFVDHRVVYILGYLPQDLLKTSIYEYCHYNDIQILAESHRQTLSMSTQMHSSKFLKTSTVSRPYRLRSKSGSYVTFQTYWQLFENPWTKEFEYLIARNLCVPSIGEENETTKSSFCKAPSSSATSNSLISPTAATASRDILDISSNKDINPEKLQTPSRRCEPSNNSYYYDKIIHKMNCSPVEATSPSETDSSGSSSENRVKRMLSSLRVNFWKIGQEIAEEAVDQWRRELETDSNSTRSTASSWVSTRSPVDPNALVKGNNYFTNSTLLGLINPSETMSSQPFNQLSPSTKSSTTNALSPPTGRPPSVSLNQSANLQSKLTYTNDQPAQTSNQPVVASTSSSSCANTNSDSASLLPPPPPPTLTSDRPLLAPPPPTASASPASGQTLISSSQETGQQDIDEAAMALVMSLLEADAGLGGPIDFGSFPWPL